jgi:hypothetical protein
MRKADAESGQLTADKKLNIDFSADLSYTILSMFF